MNLKQIFSTSCSSCASWSKLSDLLCSNFRLTSRFAPGASDPFPNGIQISSILLLAIVFSRFENRLGNGPIGAAATDVAG